jgi:hypothetical protein
MAMNVEVKGIRPSYEGWDETLKIEEYEEDRSKVELNLSERAVFDKKELLRAVRIMCEE